MRVCRSATRPGQGVRLARPRAMPRRRYDRRRARTRGRGGTRWEFCSASSTGSRGWSRVPSRGRSNPSCSQSRSPAPSSARWTTALPSWRRAGPWFPTTSSWNWPSTDYERLEVYADSLGIELATLAREHAREQGYSFVGPVRMRFEGVPDLTTGTFRIRSGVIRGTTVEDGEIRRPASDLPHPAGGFAGTPRLLVSGPEPRRGRQHAAHVRAERAADHPGPRHRLRPAPGRSGCLAPPRRAARRGRRGRPR